MALRTPPSWLQNGSHPAENDRLTMQGIIATTGIIGSSSLAVSQASTPGMAVQVAAGWGAIVGSLTTNMGVYQFYNDAATQLSVTAANPTNPRIDRVVVTVNDSYYSGATNNVTFAVIAGTPAASPTPPVTPPNSIALAAINVAAGATSILNANLVDSRLPVTTNLPVGDITEVQGGTGITVTSGTGPIPSVAINTAVTADLTTAQTLSRKAFVSPEEISTISATAATGTIQYDLLTQGILYYTSAATGAFTLNLRGNSGTTFNSITAVGDVATFVFMNTNTGTAYFTATLTIDGNAQTIKWQNGSAPTAGNTNSIDIYTFTVFKTAATPTYTVIGSLTKFA
jgi:hypothetical protein